jgi:hypothetical protein
MYITVCMVCKCQNNGPNTTCKQGAQNPSEGNPFS